MQQGSTWFEIRVDLDKELCRQIVVDEVLLGTVAVHYGFLDSAINVEVNTVDEMNEATSDQLQVTMIGY